MQLVFACLLLSGQAIDKDVTALLNQGDQLLFANKPESAREYYENARVLAVLKKADYQKFLATYKIGFSLLHEEQKFLALAHFTDIELEMICKNRADSALCLLVNTEMDLLTYKTIKSDFNLDILEQQFEELSSYLGKEERYRLFFLMGEVSFQRLDFKNAVEKYEMLIGFETEDKWQYENLFFKLAEANEGILEYPKAIEYYMVLYNTELYYVKQIKICYNLGRDYYLMNDYALAIDFFKQVLNYKKAASDSFLDILSYIWMGNCYYMFGEYTNVEKMYSIAENLAVNRKVPSDIVIPIFNAKIYFYRHSKNKAQCQNYIKKAFNYVDGSSDISGYLLFELYNQISSYYFELKDYKKVVELTDNFLEENNQLTNHINLGNTDWVEYVQLLDNKARSLHELWINDPGNTKYLYESYSIYQTILGYWKKGLTNVVSETAKLELLKSTQYYYKHYFITLKDIYYVSGDSELLDEVFNCIEQFRGYVFRDYIKESEALRYTNIPPSYIHLEAKLKKHVELLQFYLNEGNKELTSAEEKKMFIMELPVVKVRYDSLIKVLEKRFPDYYNLKYHERHFQLSEMQSLLELDQVVVEYYTLRSRLFILTITKKDIQFIEKKVNPEFLDDIKKYRTLLQNYSPWTDYQSQLNEFILLSGSLYDNLIAPIESTIKGKRIIIVPDEEINLIPFETLVKTQAESENKALSFSNLDYLVRSNAISMVYTVEQLFDKQNYLTSCSRYIGFAPTYSSSGNSTWNQLPGAKDEVKLIGNYFKGKSYLDEKATKNNFLEKSLGYDIIHLALHTKINDYNPMHSQLIFSSGSNSEYDNSLAIYEMYGIDFKSKLLVLSGCNTGSGELKTGEGVMNLARAFFYAGIKNIIVTQWSVADRSSSTLMNSFYKYLNEGENVDVALQKAKIDFIKYEDPVKHHPFYWAGYVSVGKTVEKSYGRLCVLKYYWIFLPLILLITVLILYKKKE